MVDIADKAKSLIDIARSARLCLIGGKGGVGKTTIAAGLAAALAVTYPKKRILCMSTDPAHSLSGLFIKSDVARTPNLTLQEADFPQLMKSFQSQYGEGIQSIVERGSYLAPSEMQAFVNLSWPALGELMALMNIADMLDNAEYSHVIVDTAPTGHLLRSLQLPSFLQQLAHLLSMLNEKNSIIVSAMVRGSPSRTLPDTIEASLSTRAHMLTRQLTDPAITAVIIVSLPERLPLSQTKDLINNLIAMSLSVNGIVINKIDLETEQRRAEQSKYVAEIRRTFTTIPVFTIPLLEDEPCGLGTLVSLIAETAPKNAEISVSTIAHNGTIHSQVSLATTGRMPDFAEQGKRMVIFAGKGGVGKTTIGAAAAIGISKRHKDLRILLASIDPAHSLGNALERKLNDEPQAITENLSALEVDSNTLLDKFQRLYRSEASDFLGGILQNAGNRKIGMRSTIDIEITDTMLDMDTPDLDEFLVIRRLLQLRDEFDLLFIDPPPAGHLLRFLQLPAVADDWITALLRVITGQHATEKTQQTVRELISLLKAIRAFKRELSDASTTSLIAITTDETLVFKGTMNMLENLNKLQIACNTLLVNRLRHGDEPTIPLNTQMQTITVHQASTELKGIPALTLLGESLYG